MTAEHVERLRLRFSPDDLFELVSDVRRYPDFLDPITAMRVTDDNVENGTGRLNAEARIRFKLVRERFATRVQLDRDAGVIDVEYLSGPFHDLANRWTFHRLDDGSTLVDFWIRYAFKNPVLQMLMDGNRVRAIRYLINAFQKEAHARYDVCGEADYDLATTLEHFKPAVR